MHQAHTIVTAEITTLFDQYHQEFARLGPWSAQIIAWLRAYSLRPGKAVRPWLVAVAAAASQEQELAAVWSQPAVRRLMAVAELTHKRLLMADDVVDQDDQRQGAPALHRVIARDLQEQWAARPITAATYEHLARSFTEVTGIWFQTMIGHSLLTSDLFTISQQTKLQQILASQLYFPTAAGWCGLIEQNTRPLTYTLTSENDFLRDLTLVTAHYTIAGPLQMGALTGERGEIIADLAVQLAPPTGLLFQLTDDVIGLYGDPAVTGKPVGGDVREGKKTLLMQYAYAQAPPPEQKKLAALVGKSQLTTAEVDWVRQLVTTTGARAKTQECITSYAQQAHLVLKDWPHAPTQALLQELVEYLRHRQK